MSKSRSLIVARLSEAYFSVANASERRATLVLKTDTDFFKQVGNELDRV